MVAYVIARRVAGPLTPVQLLVLLLTLEFVVQPLSTLIHELGHAAVARRVTSGPVTVVVGRGPHLSFAISRVQVNFSFLPMRGVLIRGVCRSDSNGVSWRSRARLALAGPAATILELCIGAAIGASLWDQSGVLARNVIALTLIGLITSVFVNLVPRTTGPIANDGAQALAALRHDRAQMSLPVASETSSSTRPATQTPVPMSAEVAAFAAGTPSNPPHPVIDRDQDPEPTRTSVPPPGMD